MPRHVILVGLPGAGKSVAGRLAAQELEAPFLDLDLDVEARTGMSVPAIFERFGETHFRELERAAARSALAGPPAVVAPGGGWATAPGNLDAAINEVVVFLSVTPEEAARRLAEVARAVPRPLLTPDPVERLRELASLRAAFYRRARATVDTTGRTPSDVALEVVSLARQLAGW